MPTEQPALMLVEVHHATVASQTFSLHGVVDQLFDDDFVFRNTYPSSVLVDGDEGFSFSKQRGVEVWSNLGTTFGIPRDAF